MRSGRTDHDAERHRRLRHAFEAVLESDPGHRASVIDEVCDGDPDFRSDLEALLAVHDSGTRLEDRPAAKAVQELLSTVAQDDPDPQELRRIGSYRLVERIAIGGMGAVYRAERAEGGFDHTVAIKILPFGRESEELLRRFESERRILAGLNHPNIARLFDGGTTRDGLPYIVMEYVEGRPITRFCDEERLSVDERLELFESVCDAVQAAHRALVVHRDLKPSNILVTDAGTPKLLDFGIAKPFDPDPSESERFVTATSTRPMTPAYASPEQVRGERVTTASDVYSLGALLYELLAGRPPHGSGSTVAGLEREIVETEAERPSGVVDAEAADRAHSTPDRLRRRLRGDLDNIVLMALRKEPDRRYDSVAALAADVRRHRTGHPVAARPDTWSYRMRKFARRNTATVAAVGVVLLSLLGGLGIAVWQAHEAREAAVLAERRFQTARDAARALIFDVHDEIEPLPGSTPVRETIVARAIDYLDRLAPDVRDDPDLRLDLAQAYLRIGNVQGNPTNSNLGRLQDALSTYRQGLELLPEEAPTDSIGLAVNHLRAVLHEKLGDVHAHLGEPDSAFTHLDRAIELFERNVEADPEDPSRTVALAIEHLKRGDYTGNPNFPDAGRPDEALPHYRTSLDLLQRVRARDTTDARTNRLIGLVHERLGSIHSLQGDLGRAEEAFRESKVIRDRLHAEFPEDRDIHRDAAIAHEKLGLTYQAEGRLAEARAELDTAHMGYEALAEANPRDINVQLTLAVSEMQRAALMDSPELPSYGDTEAARDLYRRALDRLRTVATLDSTNDHVRDLMTEVEAALTRLTTPPTSDSRDG